MNDSFLGVWLRILLLSLYDPTIIHPYFFQVFQYEFYPPLFLFLKFLQRVVVELNPTRVPYQDIGSEVS
ncbi:hypothetical protein AB6H26_19415 [Providencia hangzhouensis]|uniref:hypothetical protein n=1 Tax=Providencia hangzhouensis TaxID=3031799 RepID=UPI0034DD44BA